MIKLDETDFSILRILQENGLTTNKQLAEKLGLSVTPVFERVRKMKKAGIIQNTVALLNPTALGDWLSAYCTVELKEHSAEFITQFENEIGLFPEVTECYHLAGQFDYLLKIKVKGMEAYQQFITQKLASLSNLGKVQSSFVMKEIKHSVSIPI